MTKFLKILEYFTDFRPVYKKNTKQAILLTQRASCNSHMGKQNNITREILMLAMWFMKQKVILFRCRTNICDDPARPEPAVQPAGPAMTLSDGLFLKCVKRYELETFT